MNLTYHKATLDLKCHQCGFTAPAPRVCPKCQGEHIKFKEREYRKPTVASEELQIVGLEKLISLKLDSWAHTPLRRLRDKTDVIEIILRRKLPRELAVDAAVQRFYLETWDGLKAEK